MKYLDKQAKKQLGSLKETIPDRKELFSLLKKNKEHYTILATVFATVGSLVITILSIVWPVQNTNKWVNPQIYALIIAFVLTVYHVMFFTYKQVLFGLNIDEIELSEHQNVAELVELKGVNASLKQDRYFLLSAMRKIGKAVRLNDCKLEQLAILVAEIIFQDIHLRFGVGEGLTVNIYDYKDHMISMRGHYQTVLLDTNPMLFDKGVLVDSDSRIRDFCCVKLLKSDQQKKTIPNWLKMLDEFAWRHWKKNEKEKIKKKKDRRQSINVGFTYNQYIGLTHKRDDGVKFLVEIILHNDEDITKGSEMSIESIADNLRSLYTQLVDYIWNVGTLKEVRI